MNDEPKQDWKKTVENYQLKLLDTVDPARWMGGKKKPPPGSIRYASLNDRVMASLIDSIVIFALFWNFFFWMSNQLYGTEKPEMLLMALSQGAPWQDVLMHAQTTGLLNRWLLNNSLQTILIGIIIIPFWIYSSSTPGKWLWRMRIVDATTGCKPTHKQFIIRYLGYFVSGLPLFLGFIWIIFDEKKQGWHDKMAHTVVVRVKHWNLRSEPGVSEFPPEALESLAEQEASTEEAPPSEEEPPAKE